jgi:hypothetical protein
MIRSRFIHSLLSYPRRGQFLVTPRGQFSMARDRRFDPGRLRLFDRFGEFGFWAYDGVELFSDLA